MSSVKLSALLLGAVLFVGTGATTLSADMKCGAGKCGSSPEKQKKYMDRDSGKCGDAKNRMMEKDGKCGDAKKGMMNDNGKCGDAKKRMMKNDGKCGASN